MNVYELTIQRLRTIFEEFDNVYVSFSGGKDSGVVLNMCIDYLRKYLPNRKLGVFHMDYEAQYSYTTDYVDSMLTLNSDLIEPYHCCVPFKVSTCTSMYQSFWRPWDPTKREIWVRPLPKRAMSHFDFLSSDMWDYDFQTKFGYWLHNQKSAKKTCCIVGIRTQESLNRWRAVHSTRNINHYNNHRWTNISEYGIVNAYPIYDWTVEDIWTANAKFAWPYNRIYDLYYMAGLNLNQMRVASPFISEGQDTLKLYQAIEPDTWGKMIGRVNGVNFTGIYGGTNAMGWKSIKLPEGHTWESFMYFLLDSLPESTRRCYLAKLETSIEFWREKGGCLSQETIAKLISKGINIDVSDHTAYRTEKKPVKMEYLDDIDISEFKEIPTFKRMCICIMKNDHLCKYMGFSQTKEELIRRKNIISKYNHLL